MRPGRVRPGYPHLPQSQNLAIGCFNEAGARPPRIRMAFAQWHHRTNRFNEAGARPPRILSIIPPPHIHGSPLQ